MDLLILGGPSDPKRNPNPKYRGTYRRQPYHFDSLPENHEYNKMFHSYLEEGGETGVLHNLAKATALTKVLNATREESFEVVEVTAGKECPDTNSEFIGFDLSHGFSNSLLWWGLKLQNLRSDSPIAVLCDLLCEFFAPRLNQYGLFSDFETASFCLQSMKALQSFHDALFEGGSLEAFRVVGVHLVSQPELGATQNLNMATSIN